MSSKWVNLVFYLTSGDIRTQMGRGHKSPSLLCTLLYSKIYNRETNLITEGGIDMWWILQIIGCAVVTSVQMVNRQYGLGLTSWLVYSLTACTVTYLSFARSYEIAPSFTLAWMFGQTALNTFGLIGGLLIFKNALTVQQWIGVVMSIVGGYLMIK